MVKNPDVAKTEKEEAIFRAALKIIKQRGFHKARMSDIAREAGISYGLVYHYYKNKEDLFDSILKRWWDGLFYLMDNIIVAEFDVREKLSRLIKYFLETYREDPELMNIFITEISRSTTNLTSERLDYFRRFMSLTETVIAQGQNMNILRKDFKARYLTYIFLGSLEAFISTMVLGEQKIKGESQEKGIAQSILEVFLNGAREKA